MFRVRIASCGLVVMGLMLAGCSADPAPPDQPITGTYDPSTATPTSETPTQTAVSGPNGIVPVPTMSPAAMEQTQAGALAFNEYWTMTLDFLYATLDVEPFRAASAPECSFCESVLEQEGRAEAGYVYQGGRITIERSLVNAYDGSSATVTTIVSITELIVTDPQGNRDPESGPAQPRYQLVNELAWSEESWIVMDSDGGPL